LKSQRKKEWLLGWINHEDYDRESSVGLVPFKRGLVGVLVKSDREISLQLTGRKKGQHQLRCYPFSWSTLGQHSTKYIPPLPWFSLFLLISADKAKSLFLFISLHIPACPPPPPAVI
jgi:hypothetical protein